MSVISFIKNRSTYLQLVRIIGFLHKINLKLRWFLIPVAFSLCAALLDGLSVGLLIPLGNGIIRGNFNSAFNTPVLKNILYICPDTVIASYYSLLMVIILLAFTAAVLNQATRYMSVVSMSLLARKTANNLRKNIFKKYLDQGKLFFDSTSFGHLNTVLHGFTQTIASQCGQLSSAITQIIVIFVFMGMMFFLSWKVTLGVLLSVPLCNVAFRRLIFLIKQASSKNAEQAKMLQKKAFDILTCIPLVKIYAVEDEEDNAYARVSDRMEKLEFGLDAKTGLVAPVQRIFMLILVLGAVLVMAFSARQKGVVEISRMLVYFYLLREVSTKLSVFNQIKVILTRISAPAQEILKVLAMDDRYQVKSGNEAFTDIRDKIEIKKLNFSYSDNKQVLTDLSFSATKGEMTAIVGPTGAGKTTVISLILRLYDCPPNTISIDEKDIRRFEIKSLISKIALVSQETYFFNDTLKSNIAYGQKDISDDEIREVVGKARLDDFVKALPKGLDTVIGDRGVRLSGGEKQRLSIARAFLKNADILILDEATSSLDTKTEKLIQAAIEEAVQGRTTIVIAHRLSTIKNAGKIVVIEQGKLVEEGSLEDLLQRKGKFHEYWEEQKFF